MGGNMPPPWSGARLRFPETRSTCGARSDCSGNAHEKPSTRSRPEVAGGTVCVCGACLRRLRTLVSGWLGRAAGDLAEEGSTCHLERLERLAVVHAMTLIHRCN